MALYPPRTPGTDAFIRIYNNDGSEAGACGNGMRCVASLVAQETGKDALVFETKAGLINCWKGGDGLFTVDMGRRALPGTRFRWRKNSATPAPSNCRSGRSTEPVLHSPSVVNMGNPHAIFWVEDVNAYDLARFGPLLENHPIFPERANITLAQIVSRDHIVIRTWERGAGLTKACGSAACATAVAAARLKRTERKVTVTLPGGDLTIEWRESDDHVLMTGPVEFEFEGRFDPALFAQVPGAWHERRRRHLRLPAQHLRIRSHPARGGRRRPERRRGGQHLRGDGGSGAPGAPGDPQPPARAPRGADRRHRLRGADRAGTLSPPCPRSTACSATPRSSTARSWRRRRTTRRRRRHHGGERKRGRTRSTASTAARAPSCRCRTAATTAAPSASSPSAAAIRARCRWATWWRRCAGWPRQRLSRSGAHRRRHHQLWRRPAGAPRLGALVKRILQARAGARAPAAVVDRFGRGRPRPASTRLAERAAADAASASVAAGRRRSDPQAHEAPAFARRRHRVLRAGAAAAARRRLRRRHHRRLPDRDRGRCSRARSISSTNAG